jgi:hypothetical protein
MPKRLPLIPNPQFLIPCLLCLLLTAPCFGQAPLYVKKDTLAETLLAARARLNEWRAAQREARGHVKPEAWYSLTPAPDQKIDELAVTRSAKGTGTICVKHPSGGCAANGASPQPVWSKCPVNGSQNAVFGRPTPDYLLAVIMADKPVALTITMSRHESFGHWGYRPPPDHGGLLPSDALVWLNGRQLVIQDRLAGYQRVPIARRHGWSDAILIDVPLQAGENRLLITSCKRGQRAWFDAIRHDEDPAAVLWAMAENDFPRLHNRLLEDVGYEWFDAGTGWFSRGTGTFFSLDASEKKSQAGRKMSQSPKDDPVLERQFIERMVQDLGDHAGPVLSQRDKLAAARRPSSDPGWLQLCTTAAELRAALDSLRSLQAAVEALHATYPQIYPGRQLHARAEGLRQRLLKLAADHLDPADPATHEILAALARLQREALVEKNPLLNGKHLLLVKRYTYDSNHFYDEHVTGIQRFGSGFYRLALPEGTATEVAPQIHAGVIGRYDLSFDAQRILFNYKHCRPEGFRIYEMNADGSGLRQVTFPPADEEQRMAAYGTVPREELQKDPRRYGHWTDDLHPCYLPDGRIAFSSTRGEHGVLCTGHDITATNLHRINADGSGLVRLSQGAVSEFCPTMMNDGRILYNRWEYVDKGAGAVQWLWAMYPDGSRSEEIGGSATSVPPVFNQAQQVPGRDDLIVCLGAGHSPFNIGAILLLDRHQPKRSAEAMRVLTPGSLPKGNWGLRQMRNGRWMIDVYGPWYCDPFPLTDQAVSSVAGKFFLVSGNLDKLWNDEAAYGIYLLDVFGNRVPVYADKAISCWQAKVIESRAVPPVVVGSSVTIDPDSTNQGGQSHFRADTDHRFAMVPGPKIGTVPAPPAEATVVVANVYRGLDGVAPGTVKYIRVMEQVPRPWTVWPGYHYNDASPGMMVAVSLYTHLGVKVLHGIVPVREDGSVQFTVPAKRNLFFQALDKDFMEIQRMRTFVDFQPGERRSCIGCHENRSLVPVNHRPLALDYPPDRLQAQPGEVAPRPLHYPSDVQPVLDRRCVSCHNEKRHDGNLDLSGAMTELFCHSYESMIHKDLVGYIQEFAGPKPEGADAMGYAAAVPPYTYGSHKSKLISVIRGNHYDARLTREEFIKLVTWVDSNAQYYGSYFGPRNIAYRNQPGFRSPPTLESAIGIRPTCALKP